MSEINSSSFLVRQVGGAWSTPAITSYSKEAQLQQVLAEQPALIPGVGNSPVAIREMQSGAGPIDLVVIDTDGRISLVECKLSSNAQVRREIVGQVLDYASSVWRMPFVELDQRWRQRSHHGAGIVESLGAEDEEAEALVAAVEANLAGGRFNVVLVVDEINEGLRRIVEFLNDRTASDLSVLAMELRYARHADVEILTPTVFGSELVRAKAVKDGSRAAWTEDDVHHYLKERWPEAAPIITEILEPIRKLPGVTFPGTSALTPSMITRWQNPKGVAWPFVIYTSKRPYIRINFHWMTALDAAAKLRLAGRLSTIDGFTIDAELLATKNFMLRPAIDVLDVLSSPAARATFVGAFADLMSPLEQEVIAS